VSGTVEEIGEGVTVHEPGDAVYGMPRFPHPAGAYAEYVTSPARHLASKPAGLDHVQAAALPLVGLTAWQALVDTAAVQPGQRVLVHAAAGGVGHVAVQIAKARGAHVIGTATAGKHEFLRSLGADETIDYTAVDVASSTDPVDMVLDPIGGSTTLRSLGALRPGGTLVRLPVWTHADAAACQHAAEDGVRALRLLVEPDRAGLLALTGLVESGALSVTVDSVFALDAAAAAHRRVETARTTGKVVLSIIPDPP